MTLQITPEARNAAAIEALAEMFCDAKEPRVIAGQESAPPYAESDAGVQEYWRAIARLAQTERPIADRGVLELAPNNSGRIVIGRDDPLYKAFRPKPETIAAIERNEQANAQGLAAIRTMMIGHVTNWPEPKRFGTALSLIDKTLRAALITPSTPGGTDNVE